MTEHRLSVTLEIDAEPFIAAMVNVAKALSKFHVTASGIRRVDQHHPRPLSINGHEYRRRQKARSRR